jgi:bifunctional non-homologous end joining protein LigD
LVSWKWQVSDRRGLARLDYTQNAINKTLVAPYSPRAAPGAPVSAPIGWDELDDPALAPDRFTIRNVLSRIADRGDLFRPVINHQQVLPRLR